VRRNGLVCNVLYQVAIRETGEIEERAFFDFPSFFAHRLLAVAIKQGVDATICGAGASKGSNKRRQKLPDSALDFT
jgi:hypothetical protein